MSLNFFSQKNQWIGSIRETPVNFHKEMLKWLGLEYWRIFISMQRAFGLNWSSITELVKLLKQNVTPYFWLQRGGKKPSIDRLAKTREQAHSDTVFLEQALLVHITSYTGSSGWAVQMLNYNAEDSEFESHSVSCWKTSPLYQDLIPRIWTIKGCHVTPWHTTGYETDGP